jgi:hypothetical protein
MKPQSNEHKAGNIMTGFDRRSYSGTYAYKQSKLQIIQNVWGMECVSCMYLLVAWENLWQKLKQSKNNVFSRVLSSGI